MIAAIVAGCIDLRAASEQFEAKLLLHRQKNMLQRSNLTTSANF
ncbi:hypothetical protein [Mesorhizobium hawassense]|nr:hypothetical protein [Mesorhizobium hawassense]